MAALAGLAASCGGGSGTERITIYSGRTENLVGPVLEAFAEDTGIGVDVRYGQSGDLALLIDEEGDRSPADVFLSQAPGALGFLDAAGRLVPLPGEVLDLVPPEARADDGDWVGVTARVRVLVYNTDLVDPAEIPDSVLDLTDPRFAGRVAIAPANASFQDFVTAMRVLHGDDVARRWLEGMAANDSPTYANNTAIVQAVARGEVPMGLVNHYYNLRQKAEDPSSPTENHFFIDDVGSVLLVSGAAVVDTADDPATAARLVEYLLSPGVQERFAAETFEYPLRVGSEPPAGAPRLEDLSLVRVDFSTLGEGLRRTLELIEEAGLLS